MNKTEKLWVSLLIVALVGYMAWQQFGPKPEPAPAPTPAPAAQQLVIRLAVQPAGDFQAPAAEQPTPEEQGEFDFFGDTDGAEG